jgi:hypothetical protein
MICFNLKYILTLLLYDIISKSVLNQIRQSKKKKKYLKVEKHLQRPPMKKRPKASHVPEQSFLDKHKTRSVLYYLLLFILKFQILNVIKPKNVYSTLCATTELPI